MLTPEQQKVYYDLNEKDVKRYIQQVNEFEKRGYYTEIPEITINETKIQLIKSLNNKLQEIKSEIDQSISTTAKKRKRSIKV